jgi:AcrR family transcriptional regulator
VTRAVVPRRGPGRPGYDLESLLAVAVAVFNQRGYDGTSMEDLSRRLGISKSAIYHHVASKEELLSLALDRALDGLFEVAAEVRRIDAPAIDRLEQLVRGRIEVLVERLPYVTLLLRVRGNTEVERRAMTRRRQFDRVVAALVRQAEAAGDVRPDVDPAVTARLLFGLVNSLVEWYRPRRDFDSVDIADAVCTIAFDGLRVRRKRSAALTGVADTGH